MSPDVILYSKNSCARCRIVKRYLTDRGIRFEERNLDLEPEYIPKVKNLGFASVPVVVSERLVFSGFDTEKLGYISTFYANDD